MKRKMMIMAVGAICICMMAGCNKTAQVEEPVQFEDDEEFVDDFDEYEEYLDEEFNDEEIIDDEENDKEDDKEDNNAEQDAAKPEEENAAEKTEVADGTYLTDETYSGYLSDSADLLVITTALNHEDENWNKVLDYKKQEFRFPVSKDCKCVVFTEEKEENPVAERIEFINEFLEGNSGLPINLKIVNGTVEEIGFSS